MTGRSKDNWKGGRAKRPTKRPTERATERATQPTTTTDKSWKKSKRPAAAAKTGHRPWLKIVFAILSMLILVALGIWIFRPVEHVHTHFVILDLLSEPSTETGKSEFFDPAKAPEPPEIQTSQRPLGVVTSSHPASLRFAEDADTDLNKAHVVVVYLQTQLVTDGNGIIRCLNKTSTPDLQDNQSPALSELKQQLSQLAEQGKRILLIVDEVEGLNSWRLGDFQRDAMSAVVAWPEETVFQNRLVVMTAYSHSQFRVSAPGTSGGRTLFGSVVAHGMSLLADTSNSNENAKKLDVIEFCEYVLKETKRETRNLGSMGQGYAGQEDVGTHEVVVHPAPEKLKQSEHNFVLLGELPAAPVRAISATGATMPKIVDLWERRQLLNEKMAWRWRPMLWQQSTEFLLRAQQAALNQQDALADDLHQRASKSLSSLQQITSQIVPSKDQLNSGTGMPPLWFKNLPNAIPSGDSTEGLMTVSTFALQRNIASYPFAKLGLSQASEIQMATIAARKNTETASRNSMSVAGVIPQTIHRAEQQSLLTEDRLFTSGDLEKLQRTVNANQALWQAIDRFHRAHQRAEVTVQRTISQSESLAKWASLFPFEIGSEFEAEWDGLLLQSLDSESITSASLQQRLTAANQLALQTSPGLAAITVPLRSSVYRLLLCNRMLQQQLHPVETNAGFNTAQLNAQTESLLAMADRCQTELKGIGQSFEDLSSPKALQQSKDAYSEIVMQATRIEATLGVTSLPVSTRKQLIGRLRQLKQKMADMDADKDNDSSFDRSFLPSQIQAAMWYMQHFNLFRDDGATDPASDSVQQAITQLASAASADQSQSLARLGAALRNFWKRSRSDVSQAITAPGPEAPQQLRNADQRSRGFSAFDASRSQGSATDCLHKLWQVEYCLSYAERVINGQWVLPQDKPPYSQNGWFADISNRWLDQATSIAKRFTSSSTVVRPFIAKRIERLQKARLQAGSWSLNILPSSNESVDLRRSSAPDAEIEVSLEYESILPVGIAAMQLQADGENALVTVPVNSKPVPFDAKPKAVPMFFHRDGTPGGDDCAASNFRPRLFFRGRAFDSKSLIITDPCVAAKFVVRRTARPNTASVTVSGDDVRPLAFVLDMSRSMNETLQGGQRRYNVALDRLDSAVQKQDERHRGSLRVFGHRRRFPNAGENPFNEKYEAQFGKPDPGVNPHQDTVVELKQVVLGVKGKREFTDVIEKLRRTEPFGITPLLRSVRTAIQDDLNNKPGIVIAITDGIATDAGINISTFAPDSEAPNQSSDLKKAIEKNAAIKVIIVAFDFQNPRERDALTAIMQKSGIGPDQIVNARDGSELDNKIRAALDPIEYRVSNTSQGLNSTTAKFGEPLNSLRAGMTYTVEYAEIAPAKNLPAEPGDQFQLKVNWTERRFKFDREKATDEFVRAKRPDNAQTPWILRSIKANLTRPQKIGPAATGQLSVELMLDNDDDFSAIRQPKEIEFRFDSLKQYRAPIIQESYFSAKGGPGYQFRIPEWPISESVRVNAVWKMDRTTPEHVLTFAELQQQDRLPASGPFPNCRLATTLNEDGILDVRLDPIAPSPDAVSSPASENRVEDIRIEIGSRGQLKANNSFNPDEVDTAIHRTEDGAVIFRFEGDYTTEDLTTKEFAFTSRAARLLGAIRPAKTMVIQPNQTVQQSK
ncbi:MAG: hypothetical protein ABJZ55_06000 [Fuerstiella sp.]